MTELEVGALGTVGWFVRERFAGSGAAALAVRGPMAWRAAGVAREPRRDGAVRGDEHVWVEPDDLVFCGLLDAFEALRVEVNTDAWLGLARFDLQLARFPARGSRYLRHLDTSSGSAARRLTAICYLNPSWVVEDGGCLRLWGTPPTDLSPELGRLVVFRSGLVEHEVLPVHTLRYAATAWFYGG